MIFYQTEIGFLAHCATIAAVKLQGRCSLRFAASKTIVSDCTEDLIIIYLQKSKQMHNNKTITALRLKYYKQMFK